MSTAVQWNFGAFRLDPTLACLWRGEEAVVLPPKAFDVLQYLVTHPDRPVPTEELLDAVWPETTVSDTVVRIAISEVRRALGDTAQAPRFIATVPRRGYRFLVPVTVAPATALPGSALPRPFGPSPLLVERDAVLQQLQRALGHAQQGTRQVVFVTGEPGIGKTAVIATFTAQAMAHTPVEVAYAPCVEFYGPGEAYRPILEALGALCRGAGGARVVALLRQQAPTWAAQMPWVLTAAQRVQVHNELQGASRERMLREGAAVLDMLTTERPLVLVLEDLHWSDYATVDLLALLARQRPSARLLVLGTYRPGEVRMPPHPLPAVALDLQRHGLATEIPLRALSAEAVAAYLAARFPQQHFPGTLAGWLHQRTEGNPLFLVTLVQAFLVQGLLQEHAGGWTMQADLATLAGEVPASLQHVLEQQIARLAPALQQVLEVASVAGMEFAAAAVAAGLDAAGAVVEDDCDALVTRQLLHPLGVTTWPNETVTPRYAFQHTLYQQAVYARVGAGRRVRLHQRLGTSLEAAYGAQAGDIAAELAGHFERGHDVPRAVCYLQQAAEKATQRYAPQDVVTLLTRALTLLEQVPATAERAQHELALHMLLGPALIATKGHAAPEVQATYARARVLCHQVPESAPLPQTLVGLSLFHTGYGDHQTAQAIGLDLLRLAQRLDDPVAHVYAHSALGVTTFYRGDVVAAQSHFAHGIALDQRLKARPQQLHALFDCGVICRIGAALVLQQLGYPEQARQRGHEALALTQASDSPFNRCNLLLFLALLQCFRREWPLAQQWVEEALSLATALDFPLLAALGTLILGATRTAQDDAQAGLAHLQHGFTACATLGTQQLAPWGLAMLAESYARLGHPDAGLRTLAETTPLMATTGDRFYAAEISRLEGELHLQVGAQASTRGPDGPPLAAAAGCFQHALAVARRQQARWWELQAAMSLARLWQQQGQRTEAYTLLAPVYGWFTEGFDTADLQEAKALLEALT
jgi:DNA-binding winged helix-turn-helix (wHTH) protein